MHSKRFTIMAVAMWVAGMLVQLPNVAHAQTLAAKQQYQRQQQLQLQQRQLQRQQLQMRQMRMMQQQRKQRQMQQQAQQRKQQETQKRESLLRAKKRDAEARRLIRHFQVEKDTEAYAVESGYDDKPAFHYWY